VDRLLDAGADRVYPIGVRHKQGIAALVAGLPGPVNGNTGEYLDLATLRELGVARVSYGPRFYRAAMAGLKTAVQELMSLPSGPAAAADASSAVSRPAIRPRAAGPRTATRGDHPWRHDRAAWTRTHPRAGQRPVGSPTKKTGAHPVLRQTPSS
jgi:hypothetical protein